MSFTICEPISVSRYYDMNTFFSSQYRSYNKSTQPYLHNRSKTFVLNYLEKRGIASSSDLTGITCQGKGSFSALNFSNDVRESYEVHFGKENETPKCSCLASLNLAICLNTSLQFLKKSIMTVQYFTSTLRN